MMRSPSDLDWVPPECGQLVRVRLTGEDIWRKGVWLGPAGHAVDRLERRMLVIDDDEAWRLIAEFMVSEVETDP